MNNIAQFLTQLAGSGASQGQTLLGQGGLLSQGETGDLKNLDFWKAVLTEANPETSPVFEAPEATEATSQANTLIAMLSDNNAFDLSDALSGINSEGLKTIESELIVLKTVLQNPETLKQFEQLQKEGLTIEQLTDRIDIVRKQIELLRVQRGEDEPLSLEALIAAGLSPSQITEVIRRVDELETKLDRPIQ